MAEYLIQDTTLTAIGDSIRAKEESSAPIPVSEIAARIAAIETGVTVQRASGTFTTNTSGKATVNCGFKPDLVAIDFGHSNNCVAVQAFAIGEYDYSGYDGYEVSVWDDSNDINLTTAVPTATGFTVEMRKYDMSSSKTILENEKFSYIAVKYT